MGKIFGADGIRAAVNSPIFSEEGIERLGLALSNWLSNVTNQPVMLIATDTRESCHVLKSRLLEALNNAGINTIDADILPTAAVSYLIKQKGFFAGGLMISASHSPINENGIKVFDPQGVKISEEIEERIEADFISIRHSSGFAHSGRNFTEPDYSSQYVQGLVDDFQQIRWTKSKVLMDCANGAAYQVGPKVFRLLGIDSIIYNDMPDGTNINRRSGSEYARVIPSRLWREMSVTGSELAIAFDGDADRVIVVDALGHFYDGDMMLALFGYNHLTQGTLTNNKVVYTRMSNSGLKEYFDRLNIESRIVQNGDKYITKVLIRENLILGAEQIGHVILHSNPSRVTGDGIRTALALIDLISRNPGVRLHEMAPGMRKWPQIIVSVPLNCRVDVSRDQIPGLVEEIAEIESRFSDVKVKECRPASTEPTYRIMMESRFTPPPIMAAQAGHLARLIQNYFDCTDEEPEIFDLVNGGKLLV